MRRTALILLFICVITFLAPYLSPPVNAGDLGTLVRLSRTALSTATGGTICATPQSTGTETSLQIVFPTGFTLNQNASSWTVTTTNLPQGSVAMPGVTKATAVSGQIVTFPINDLSQNTQYCFNFSGNNTLTTPSSTGTYNGIVRTMNAANNVVDYRAYAISVLSNDSINVTATVPANPTDFAAHLVLSDPINGTFPQNSILTYRLSYGNNLSYPTDITVEASWDLGTIVGDTIPSVSVVDYVVGSASMAYNNALPVIDSVNRKISWTIQHYPGNTNNSVVFQLITKSSYTGSLPVAFTISGRTYGLETVTADSTVTSRYQDSNYITPTPTPTCAPGLCPTATPGPTATPTPTQTPSQKMKIADITIRTVSATNAAIFVDTTKPTKLKISYGTSENSLTRVQNIALFDRSHLVKLTGLFPNTRYYFQITATDENGNSVASDLYLLDTAVPSIPPSVLYTSLVITSNDVILTDTLKTQTGNSEIVLPSGAVYAFRFGISEFAKIKSVKALARNNAVLGLTSSQAYANTDELTVSEISPGQYIGRLLANPIPDIYRIYIQIQDYNGNITEEPLALLRVVTPFTVINTSTKQPIENAKVVFSFFNPRTKLYETLTSAITPIKNPNYSEPDGTVATVLPQGLYRAEVSEVGYKPKKIEFAIGPNGGNYPTVELTPLPFRIGTYLTYSVSTALDVMNLAKDSVHKFRESIRFFDLVGFITVLLLLFISSFSTARKIAVPIHLLPYYAFYHITKLFKKERHTYVLHGKVVVRFGDEAVTGATIYIKKLNGRIITHTTTNGFGEFIATIKDINDVKITVSKKGFANFSSIVKAGNINEKMKLELVRSSRPPFSLLSVSWYFYFLSGTMFETILILTLILEFLFLMEFGVIKTLPFIIVSLFNILLWTANIKSLK